MTEKELLYLEDAYSHEDNIIKIINDTITKMKDKKLKEFLKKELKNHELMMGKIINKMGDKSNE